MIQAPHNPLVEQARAAAEKLLREIQGSDHAQLVRERLFTGTPYVFRERPELFNALSAHLASELAIDQDSIRIVGSAMTGFSLSPLNFGRPFNEGSDIDVVVVSEALFDEVWAGLQKWRYPWHLRRWEKSREGPWGKERLEELVLGWCNPIKIDPPTLGAREPAQPLRDFAWRWLAAFNSVGRSYAALARRQFTGRLYRTWEYATRYHAYGFGEVLKRFPPATP